jgi:hypothetical protein
VRLSFPLIGIFENEQILYLKKFDPDSLLGRLASLQTSLFFSIDYMAQFCKNFVDENL